MLAPSSPLPPGAVRASPFVRRAETGWGLVASETVSGQTYMLEAEEARLLDACSGDTELAALSDAQRSLARSLVSRLLLLDADALAVIGRLAVSELDLEVAGNCNAECIFCPREELRQGRGVGVMSAATFERVLACFGGSLRFVGFAGIGEPTLHKELPRFLRAFSARGVRTALVTNGSRLTDELIGEILGAGVGSVQVSFNGNVRASYEEHMVGLDFEETRGKVERLVELARPARIPVHVSAVETNRNRAALAGFVEHWRGLGAQASVVPCHSRGGNVVELRPHRPVAAEATTTAPRCGLFNRRCFVSWDGRVLACCHDVDGGTLLGDVHTDDAATIIARKLDVMAGDRWFPICAGCDEGARLHKVAPAALRRAG